MSNGASAEVIRYLRRKSSNGFDDISWIGAEQRFVNALRNSGINNLEEQYIIGPETYTVEYEDLQGNQIIEKSFCVVGDGTPATQTDYYKLVTTKYNNAITNYYFENNRIVMPDNPEEILFGDGSTEHPDINSLYCEDDEVFSLTTHTFGIGSKGMMQTDELYFIKSGQPDLLVISKQTITRIDELGRRVTREKIENHLHA